MEEKILKIPLEDAKYYARYLELSRSKYALTDEEIAELDKLIKKMEEDGIIE